MNKNSTSAKTSPAHISVFLYAVFHFATLVALTLIPAQQVAAQRFLDISPVSKYLPDSLRQRYPAPMLADDDTQFALDSTGKPLYLQFVSNKSHSVVVVVDPSRGKDSALIWASEPLEGRIDYLYVADINRDNHEEIVVSSRALPDRTTHKSGWNRVYLWRWPLDNNPDSVLALAPCSDTLHPYFQALTKVEVTDTGANPDGVSEVVVTSIVSGLATRERTIVQTVYYWTGDEYCVKR